MLGEKRGNESESLTVVSIFVALWLKIFSERSLLAEDESKSWTRLWSQAWLEFQQLI